MICYSWYTMIFRPLVVDTVVLAELLAQMFQMRQNLLYIFLLCGLSGLSAQKPPDFELELQKVENLTYDVSSFDSAYAIADNMLKTAETDLEKGLANFAKAEVIVKNGWGYYLGEYGVPYLEDAINYFALTDRKDLLSDAFSTLSVSYITKYNPDNKITSAREIEYLRIALEIQNNPEYKLPTPFNANLEDKNTTPADLLPAIEVVEKDLETAQAAGDRFREMYRTEKLGYLYWQLDHTMERCEAYLIKAGQLATELNMDFFHSVCLGQLAVYSNQAGEFNKGLEYALEGLQHSQGKSFIFRETIFRDQLYQSYLALGKEKEALMHKAASLDLSEKAQQLTYSKRHKMVSDRIREMEYRKTLESELEQKNHRLSLIYFGIIGLLLVTLVVIYSNLRLRTKNKEILEASLAGQSLERKRVAADLHDNLGSTLSSIRWSLDTVDMSGFSEDQNKVFLSLKENLDKAYGDIRLLAHNLLPVTLEEVGLCAALLQLNQKLNKNRKTEFKFTCENEFPRMNRRLEFELYSICLELYSNIIKHANAHQAETSIYLANGKIHLTITDDGIGYETEAISGMGLKNIQERIDVIQGCWIVSHESGTKNQFVIPLS